MNYNEDIYSYIKSETANFQTARVPIVDGWEWNMFEHIRQSVIYKFGQFLTGKKDDKPNKNIILPLLRLRYRTEGFDVKDVLLWIDSAKNYWKSFFVRKFHEKFAERYKLDTFIDKCSETDIDFGGVLIKDVGEVVPEVIPWQSIAFCDQTDILGGPFGIKHFYSPQELQKMKKKGWKNVDELIILAENYKTSLQNNTQARTPGKYIEVYEVHGNLPAWWLTEEKGENTEYTPQLQIVAFYEDGNKNKNGITLYKGKETELPFKLCAEVQENVYNRALGYGGVEELIEPQVWTNYDIIRIKEMLDFASKVIFQTADSTYATKNRITDLENGEILITEKDTALTQVNTFPANFALFEKAIVSWKEHARETSAATESLMGESPTSGTPFKLQELITNTSLGLHDYRMGKFAVWITEVYQDWIIPRMMKEVVKGQEFLSELDLEELKEVADRFVENRVNEVLKEKILNGETIFEDETEKLKQETRDEFMKAGNKRFVKILKDELRDAPVSVRVNIKGKQKDLARYTDKLVNIFRFIIGNPQGFMEIMKMPGMNKTFNEILETSGLSPIDFGGYGAIQPEPQPQMVENQLPQLANAGAV